MARQCKPMPVVRWCWRRAWWRQPAAARRPRDRASSPTWRPVGEAALPDCPLDALDDATARSRSRSGTAASAA